MKNYTADSPHFRISDDVADFFGPLQGQYFPQVEGPVEEERLRRETERDRIREMLQRPPESYKQSVEALGPEVQLLTEVVSLPENPNENEVGGILEFIKTRLPAWNRYTKEDCEKLISTANRKKVDEALSLLKRQVERLESFVRDSPNHVASMHGQWDTNVRSRPWLYPTVNLAMRTDLFREADLRVFINRARLEAMRSMERLAKLAQSIDEVTTKAEAVFDAEVARLTEIADARTGEELDFDPSNPFGISRSGFVDYEVAEWQQATGQNQVVPEIARAFVEAMETVLAVRGKPEAYSKPVNVSLSCLAYWWKKQDLPYGAHAKGTFDGLFEWVQSVNGLVVNENGGEIRKESLRTKFNSLGKDAEYPEHKRRFEELDLLFDHGAKVPTR